MDKTSDCPEKYIADDTRDPDRVDYGTPYFGMSVDGYEIWANRHLDQSNRLFVHRLLAVVKYGFDAVCGKIVHHKNGISFDNRYENIEIMSQEEHVREHFKNGDFNRSAMTEERVAELRRNYEGEKTFSEIAESEPVDEAAIRDAIRGDSWGWVDEEPVKPDGTHTTAKLTKEGVKKIRKKHEPYETTYKDLSDEFNVSESTIRNIVNYNSWKDVS